MTERLMQAALFVVWPAIAFLLVCCVMVFCAVAWVLIPFGTPTKDGSTMTLKFPWSKE